MPTNRLNRSTQPLNSSGRPAFFTPPHNAWIESQLALPRGSVSRIYQDDPVCVLAAKHAIRRKTPPTSPEILAPFRSSLAATATTTIRRSTTLPRFQQRIQERDDLQKDVYRGRRGHQFRQPASFASASTVANAGLDNDDNHDADDEKTPLFPNNKNNNNSNKNRDRSLPFLPYPSNPKAAGRRLAALSGIQRKQPIQFRPAIPLGPGEEEEEEREEQPTRRFRHRDHALALRYLRSHTLSPSPPPPVRKESGYGNWSYGDLDASGKKRKLGLVEVSEYEDEDEDEDEEEGEEIQITRPPNQNKTANNLSTSGTIGIGLGISTEWSGGLKETKRTGRRGIEREKTPIYHEEMQRAGRRGSIARGGISPVKKQRGSLTKNWW